MGKWKETTLDEIAFINPPENLKNGIKAKKVTMDMLIPFTKIIPTYSIEEYKGGMKFRNGDTLIARITPCLENGKTAYVDILDDGEIGFGSTEFIVLREKEDRSDKHFLYYFSMSPNFRDVAILSMTGSSGRQRVQTEVVRNHLFLFPPLPEQRAIASVLGSLDDKIDLLNRENQTLEQMAEAIFRQWFIEEADEKWEEVPLSEVFDFKEGPGIRNWQYRDNGIPFINIRLISNGEIDVSKANFVSEAEANAKYKHFYLQRKDMVVSTSGTLGKVAIIRNYHLPLLLNTSVIRFRPKDGINFSFMYGYLRSNEFYECLIDSASGSVQLNFGPIHLKQIVMKIPPNEKLEYFRKVVDPIYEKFELNYNQIRTLEKLRDTLLPKLMSGEVRVKLTDSEVQK
ncbi:MAG: EcoKI restriction-modification system protein HsdS [Deltaproteobacteria bacterium ADurb.Bin135]|nr:MAG: EcoKI restriction-modification system protein HsdS [Deltaproteobacteria bacterium ADurb.Bin135]